MKKINILKENKEFNRIINNIRPLKTKYFNIFLDTTEKDKYLFGFVVSKKMGNAVTRNFIKRRIKSIVAKKEYKTGLICLIMCKRNLEKENYDDLEKDLVSFFNKHNLYKERI